MKTWFVEANVFLRFLTVDDRGQREMAARFLERASRGEIRVVCGPPVFFELAWTLRSAHKIPKEKTLAILSAVYSMPGIILADGSLVEKAITLATETASEFADAYIAASAQRLECSGIATFNRKDLSRLGCELADL